MLPSVERISVSPVFIGRGSEMAALTQALQRADGGQPQVLLIGGEAGVGKTRLLEEFQHAAEARGASVAVGGCLEIGAEGLPYAPFATVLRRLHRGELGPGLELAAVGRESSLARLLPDMLPDMSDAPAESHDEYARARLFDHTAQLFEQLTAERTLVLAVEDLHWSDRSTRELFAFLVRTLHRARLVLLGTYRTDDLHRRHPVRPYLAELERLRTVQRLELPRLAQREVARQLAGILSPSRPSAELVQKIFRRSEGNPFFVEELAVSHQQGCSTGLTDSLRDLLLVRMEALPEETQTMLRVLAAGGSRVEHGLLAAVLESAGVLDEDELIDALRTAVGANIIQPTSDGDGYRFRHALVREAVSDDLMPGECTRINRRYAMALEADPPLVSADQRSARLAGYWYCAHDAARAVPAVLNAGREARRRNAFAEQLRMLDRALELWDDVPDEVRATLRDYDRADESYPSCSCDHDDCGADCGAIQLIDLLAEATVAARLSGETDRGLRYTKRALRLLDEQRTPERAAWFRLARARALRYDRGSRPHEDLQGALELLEGRKPSAVLAELLHRQAADGMLSAPRREHLDTARRAAEIAEQVGATSVLLHARLTLGVLHCAFGELETGAALLAEVQEQAEASDDMDLRSRVYTNLSSHHELQGRSRRAIEVARTGLAVIRANGMAGYAGTIILGNLAEPLISLGELDEAAQLLAEEPDWSGQRAHRDFMERLRGEIAYLRGDLVTATEHLAEARRPGTVWQPQKYLPVTLLAMRIAAAQGRYADARAELLTLLEAGRAEGHDRSWWALLATAAGVEADARHLPTMAAGRAEILARIREVAAGLAQGVPLYEGWSAVLTAELARAEGTAGVADWRRAADALSQLECPFPRDLALLRLAEAYAATGEKAAASAAARESAALACRHGDQLMQRELRSLAERARLSLDAAASEAGPEPDDTFQDAFHLTPRERDVLKLLALGRTNRQIAEELFISPKTASVHVSNILAKLEVTGRGEAAAVAHRLRLVPAG
ncbi:helix-turn-helix transcriptional regulator [Streptacidiphilus fuscans]|uniref:AAA family ATPase n=1 Tax=Streptacidiphilus fuscans TaxID=2789292 RepID=A0A931FEB8_9ACTN|nr:helix-turn-helix transcriptional regulator [Streptacidiphilus fuscans]MBF9067369.1 AAA family ATPase [Streptacidiphilus fuscans]